jgi:hypothetical protein
MFVEENINVIYQPCRQVRNVMIGFFFFRALSHTVINAQTLRVYMFMICKFILQKTGDLLLTRCSEGRYTEQWILS